MSPRATRVNGVDVADRPECPDGKHEFAAHHGYCLVCGLDSWAPDKRRAVEADQRAVEYPTRARPRR
jgi:hypothetical protein